MHDCHGRYDVWPRVVSVNHELLHGLVYLPYRSHMALEVYMESTFYRPAFSSAISEVWGIAVEHITFLLPKGDQQKGV